MDAKLDEKTRKQILAAQKNEITEHFIYSKLAAAVKEENNKKILKQISADELRHSGIWKKYTKEDVKPNNLKVLYYYLISRIFGITFGIKLMENGEKQAQLNYDGLSKQLPEAKMISKDEDEHERKLINMIDEERLQYVGSIVLGLSDALVELTGALAGFTLALQNTQLVAVTGLITGIAASLSMAASEYLSTKTEGNGKSPLKASIYTGGTYVLTVLFLIFPFLILTNIYFALGLTMLNAIIVILIFTFYISVAKDLSFRKRFLEMALISLGVAAITFGIGFLIRVFWNIEI